MEAAARIQFLRDWSLVSMAGRPAVLPEYGRRGVTHKEAGPHVSKGLFYPRDTVQGDLASNTSLAGCFLSVLLILSTFLDKGGCQGV